MYSVLNNHKALKKHFPGHYTVHSKFKDFSRLYEPCFHGDIHPNFQGPLTMARKKGPSGSLEQVHFLAGQATFKAYLLNGQNKCKSSSNKIINLGCIPLGWSRLRTAIWDHSVRGRLNEPMNPLGTRIHRFIILIYHDPVITDRWSWNRSSQRNAPLQCRRTRSRPGHAKC